MVIAADGDAMFAEGGLIALAAPTEEVWSADLTVGTVPGTLRTFLGYLAESHGSLTDEDFSYAGEDYRFSTLYYSGSVPGERGNSLFFTLDSRLPAGAQANLVLRVGDRYHPGGCRLFDHTSSISVQRSQSGLDGGRHGPGGIARLHHAGPAAELVATAQGARAVELSWTAPEVDGGGVVGYRVESSVDGGVSWRELAADTGTPATSYRDASVGLGETRHYRVRGSVATATPAALGDGVGDGASRHSRHRGDVDAGSGEGHVSAGRRWRSR